MVHKKTDSSYITSFRGLLCNEGSLRKSQPGMDGTTYFQQSPRFVPFTAPPPPIYPVKADIAGNSTRLGYHPELNNQSVVVQRTNHSATIEKKSESNPNLLKLTFHELQSYYSDHEHIYTGGSKDEGKVGCAAAKFDNCKTMCIPEAIA